MAASSRPALTEKDVNAPLTTSKQSLVKTTAATHPTPPKQPWPQRRTLQTLNADFLSTNQGQGRDDAMATSENSSQAVASGQPPPEAGLTHDAMIDVVGADANEVAESITVESGRDSSAKRARGDSADTNQGQAHSSTRRRLASPFSEDVTPSVTQSQPIPLTQEQLSATPQHGHLVRSFSVSPTLVDRASKPSVRVSLQQADDADSYVASRLATHPSSIRHVQSADKPDYSSTFKSGTCCLFGDTEAEAGNTRPTREASASF